MPCKPRKARMLLKNKQAKILKYEPFTIQLLYGSSGYKQKISLGIDAGSKHVGASATTKKDVTKLHFKDGYLYNDGTKWYVGKFDLVACGCRTKKPLPLGMGCVTSRKNNEV